MKISQRTFSILKNFTNLSSGLFVKAGNTLTSCTATHNIFAEAVVEENFPMDFGIYDLNNFLSVISLFKETELQFNDKFVWIGAGKSRVKYVYCDVRMLESDAHNFSSSQISFEENFLSFKLLNENIIEILKGSSLLELPNIVILAKDGLVSVSVYDQKNKTSNLFELDLPEAVVKATKNFKIELDVDNLKFLPGNYDVDVYQYPAQPDSGIVRFKHTTPLQYFVAAKGINTF